MENLVKAQRSYFNSNATKSIDFRIAQLQKFYDLILENEEKLSEAIRSDYGKGKFETFLTELYIVYDELKTAIKELADWAAVKPTSTNLLNQPASSYVIAEPLGVSLIIGPWNYPYQLTLGPVVAAMAAGCTIVLKPSELTAHSSSLVAKLVNENFDPAYFVAVEGAIPETTDLLAQRFDVIFFTGSVPVGKIVYQAAAKFLTPVILELGGKSPVIVTEDSDLDVAARRLVWAKFINGGQTCIAPDYVYVHESVEREFLEKVAAEIEKADYKIENENYVYIINQRNAARVSALIDPSKVIVGGRFDVEARFIEPTIMRGVTWEDNVMKEEIFGPVLPFLRYSDLNEVIQQIKERPKPLSLYLFTGSESVKAKVLNEISFGGGCVNDALMHISNGQLPFGGVGDSGIGNYHGIAGFNAFSHFKSILDREIVADPDIKYSPHTEQKLEILKSVVA